MKRFGSLTNEELEKQGFVIESLEPNLYQVHKGTMRFLIDNNDGFKTVRIPALGMEASDTLHDDFIELCDASSIDPNISLKSLFENEELFAKIVQSKKDGSVRFLESACIIKLEDIYIRHEDVHRLEQQTTITPLQNMEDIDAIINTTLKTDLNTLLRKTFPEYSGQIAKKTSAPYVLLIKVIVMMKQLQHHDITWTTIREFKELPIGEKDGSHFLRTKLKTLANNQCRSRSENNAESTASILMIDCDKGINQDGLEIEGAPDLQLIHEVLLKLNIGHIIYGSHSHYSGNKGNRYRIIVLI